jgi:transcriptional regulator with XRE-family HTH domain
MVWDIILDMKRNTTFENSSGEALVNRIDSVLSEIGKSRKELCKVADISIQSINNWKKQNSVPAADTAIKIANYLEVSVEWLINGELNLSGDFDSQPSQVYYRIYNLLLEKTGLSEPDNAPSKPEVMFSVLHKPLSNIISNTTLNNWRQNRACPDGNVLLKIAEYFNQSFAFLATGKTVSSEINGDPITKEDYQDYCIYKKHKELIWSFELLYDADKRNISRLIARLFRLRRHIENRDFNYKKIHETGIQEQADINIDDNS